MIIAMFRVTPGVYISPPFQRPIGPAIGLFCQFIIMPCNAYFLGWLFLETSYERLGLLLLGSSPGGANSNFWVGTITISIDHYVTLAQQMFKLNKT